MKRTLTVSINVFAFRAWNASFSSIKYIPLFGMDALFYEKDAFQALNANTFILTVNDNVNEKENSKLILIDCI
jgi:hypothetical protein